MIKIVHCDLKTDSTFNFNFQLNSVHPSYLKVFLTFARNSLIRDMSFRMNFILQCLSSMSWAAMNWGLFKIIYQHTGEIGRGSGWHENEFFVFLGTIWIINSLIQTFFMANAEEFSELIRTGNLDFALLKPIDTQFLISFPRLNWAQMPNGMLGVVADHLFDGQFDGRSDKQLHISTCLRVLAFVFFVLCGAVVMYSVMIMLASTSIWLGRNQNLYNFWFYITNFYRYPDGDLSAQRNRHGVVGDFHVRHSDPGGLQRAGPSSGPTAGHAVEDLGMGVGGIRDIRALSGCLLAQSLGISTSAC